MNCNEIPDNMEFHTDLPLINTEYSISVKASYDDFAKEKVLLLNIVIIIMISIIIIVIIIVSKASKEKQLEQLRQEITDIEQTIKEIRRKESSSSPTVSKSKSTKDKKSKKSKTVKISEEPPSSFEVKPSLLNQVGEALGMVLATSIQQRAYVLFGIAAVGIYIYGDNASV